MIRLTTLGATAIFVLCLSFSGLQGARGQETPGTPETNYAPHSVLVRFQPWTGEDEKAAVRSALGATKIKVIRSISVEYWKLPQDVTTEQALEFLRETPAVESAQPDYLYKPKAMPDDPFFSRLWYLDNTGQTVAGIVGTPGADISATPAWDIERGSPDVVIAVIDSGVAFEHPDLTNNVWTNKGEIPNNGIDDDHNGYIDDVHGWDFVNDDNNPSDYSKDVYGDGHGTHVAGIIAAEGDNGIGTTGIMWHARIMPLQIFDLFQTGSFAEAVIEDHNIALAIEYAVNNGASIINCSLGGSRYSQYQYDMINYANQHGVLVVCAAGNDSADNDVAPTYPAGYDLPNIISVAATNESDQLASYSNYGVQTVDVAAPGGNGSTPNIYSTTPPERKILFSDDFEHGLSKWITSGTYEKWSIGYDALFGSNVVRDSVKGYHENEDSYLRMAHPVDAANYRGLVLSFKVDFDLEYNYDFCFIEGSQDGLNYVDLNYLTGSSGGVAQFLEWYSELDVDQFYLGFRLKSDYIYNFDGVSIDDLVITGIPWEFKGNEYGYKSGTSMAAPVVSGLAGLIWSLKPSLSYLEVKNIILESVDTLPSLDGKILSGGRVNAYKALSAVVPELHQVPNGPNTRELISDERTDASVTLGSVVTGGSSMELAINTPPHEAAVDIYAGVQLPDGRLFVIDPGGGLTTEVVPYATGITDARRATLIDSFDVCTDAGASVPEGTWQVYYLVVPANGGNFSAIDWANGDYDLEYYSFDVTCPR